MDFKLLRDASDRASSTPILLSPLTRELVLLIHRRALEDIDAQSEVRTRKMVVGPGKHFSKAILEDLEEMELGEEVLCNEVARGKTLVCRVISRCLRTVAVQFVVEDCRGRAVPVHLYHVPARLSSTELDQIYPLGATFAIKEPYFRESQDAFLIRIDSPPDLVRLYPSSPHLSSICWFSPLSGSPPPRTASQNKDEGNRAFALRKWHAAIEAYSLGLDLESKLGGKLSTALLANRAAAALKVDRPGAALRDCEEALADPALEAPLKRKVSFRAASAEYLLQRFSAANARLGGLLELYPADFDALDLHRRTQTRLAEATRGEFDWPLLFEQSQTVKALDVATFTGTMIAPAPVSGRGRGLVATRDIRRGELLLVAKPFGMGTADTTQKSYVVGANLFTETMDPYATVDLTALLVEKLVDNPDTTFPTLFDLHPGDEGFSPYSPTSSPPNGIDTSRIEAIVTFNGFHTESLVDKTTPADDALANIHAPSSLYHTPSYLNHSCIGNVSYSFLADTLFLRARRDLKMGEELVDSYVDSMAGLPVRESVLQKHGFVCHCPLCLADRADDPSNRAERERVAEELEALTDEIHRPAASTVPTGSSQIGKILSLVERIQRTYAADRGPLRPASYRAWRLLSQTYAGLGGKEWAEAAVRTEVKGLEALGAVFGEGEVEGREMLEEARVGDVNAVLSALFVATQMRALGKPDGVRHWVGLARRMEAGQAGEPLFRVRYAEWAEKHGLDLDECEAEGTEQPK